MAFHFLPKHENDPMVNTHILVEGFYKKNMENDEFEKKASFSQK